MVIEKFMKYCYQKMKRQSKKKKKSLQEYAGKASLVIKQEHETQFIIIIWCHLAFS